ncbi:MAG: ATP synthase F1 subunit gamma [bacterium]|nr:ATP synthase F1 subunit gamma [bacterium]MDT8367265.1 ATP synthase F1 subunit gamma [bacterium]
MGTLREIKRRITSVQNTEQITKAMKMVATSRLRRAQAAILANRPYAHKMLEVLSSLALRTNPQAHPLLHTREPEKVDLIVVTSDRGLCGAFNSNIIRQAERFMRQHPDWEFTLHLVGRKANDYFKRRDYNIRKVSLNILSDISFPHAIAVGDDVVEHYLSGELDQAYMVYNEFKSAMQQTVIVEQLLPIKPMEISEDYYPVEYTFEPSEDVLLEQLLPRHINVQVYRVFLESVASEHGARMTAMESASRNAGEMIEKLTLIYNRTRQAAITTELIEVVSGKEAMK